MAIPSPIESQRRPGRLFLVMGLGLAALGIVAYIVQIKMQRLSAPWYMPFAATLGALFVAFSLLQRRTSWRVVALVLVLLVAGAEWAFMTMLRLPPYTGPVTTGRAFPAFSTLRADGTPFTDRELQGNKNSALVFFRGRW